MSVLRMGPLGVLTGRATLIPVAYSIVGVLPLFLVSAQTVALSRDLDLSRSRLGLVVSACFAASALTATPLGHLVARIGPAAGLRLSAAFSLAALLWLALGASAWWHVALALAACGLANATAQVATNLALAGGVSPERQGLAFGAKYAAIPTASLAAGLALPLIALVADWRTGALGAAAIVAAAVVVRPHVTAAGPARRRERGHSRPSVLLVAIGITGLLAGGIGNAVPAFTVDSAVSRGIGEHEAALILAVGSGAALLMRIAGGWVADRRGSIGLSELTALTAAGALSFALLVLSGGSDLLFVLGMLAAFAAAWGWPGLIHFATARTHRSAQAPATGFVLSCVYAGNVLGPGVVGLIVEHGSYRQAWLFSAFVLALATLAGMGARRLARAHPAHTKPRV